MSQRRAVTRAITTRYKRADKAAKGVILDELCGDDRLAPKPCLQGTGRGVEAQDRGAGPEGRPIIPANEPCGEPANLSFGSFGSLALGTRGRKNDSR